MADGTPTAARDLEHLPRQVRRAEPGAGRRPRPRLGACGSTNWTRSGVYLQANVVHVAERPELAGRYQTLFELLFGGATVAEARQWIDANDPLPTAGFSPRSGEKDLDAFVATIDQAERDTRQPSGILIHTKLVVVNFTSDEPIVISGSHNLSAAASGQNDENFLVVRGDTDVADCYGVELMRLYDHYRYRWAFDPDNTDPRPADPCAPRPPSTLCPDDRWTTNYFEPGTLEAADRERFGAPVS